jgi:hypothetical protein
VSHPCLQPIQHSPEQSCLLEWDEARGGGCTDTSTAVPYGLVCDGAFPKVVAHHLGLHMKQGQAQEHHIHHKSHKSKSSYGGTLHELHTLIST